MRVGVSGIFSKKKQVWGHVYSGPKSAPSHRRRSPVFIVEFEHISVLFLKFLLLTLSR